LYLLLRLSTWEERKKLSGRLSGALWIRHVAEVLRRVFEDVHATEWFEEDRAFGTGSVGGRKSAFGSERPLDNQFRSKPHLAYRFGLFTGSAIRWYVEGETEYFAVRKLVPDAADYGIELVDLRGEIGSDRRNAARKLEDLLKDDHQLRRFSIVSFDFDVPANRRIIGRQAEQGNIVGMVAVHKPDFEFANFDLDELVEVAARLDQDNGFNGDLVRTTVWTGTSKGGDFEKKYKSISGRGISLKGEAWGTALADFAAAHPLRPSGKERPIWGQVQGAKWAWRSNYDYHKEHYKVDPITFAQISR
jgi:hypothetical protein